MKKIIKNNRCLMVSFFMLILFSYDTTAMDFWTQDPWADPYGLIEDQYQQGYQDNPHYYPEQSIDQYIRDAKYLQTQEIDINNVNNPNPHAREGTLATIYPPLVLAIADRDVQKMQVLLRAGADVKKPFNRHNDSFLNLAVDLSIDSDPAEVNKLQIVRILVEAGANVNAKNLSGRNLLCRALLSRSLQTAQLLLNAGADASIAGDMGMTALDMAIDRKLFDIVQAIMDTNHHIFKIAFSLRARLENDPRFKLGLQGEDRERMMDILGNLGNGLK